MNYIKVMDHDYLVRDSSTGAIINTDKKNNSNFLQNFNSFVKDINILKDEISEIKSLLKKMVENGNNP